jgi:predicted nucleic acid-binding protein
MNLYPDTSFVVASRYRRDTFHAPALDCYADHEEDAWLWSPWHRVEVLHALRQYTQHPDTRRAMPKAEAKALIHRLEKDVRLGYLLHVEPDWQDALRTANELSAAHGFELHFRAGDLMHVAYAVELVAELFVSFDTRQLALAEAAGLTVVNPAGPGRGRK